MKTEIKNLGILNLTSGKLMATDPCYNNDVWCKKELTSVKPGEWEVAVEILDEGEWGKRISKLSIKHINSTVDFNKIEDNGSIGVDAGLAGFFENKPNYDDNAWSDICDYLFKLGSRTMLITTPDSPFKCNGVCVSSGYGDGDYALNIIKDSESKIVYAEIIFIDPDKEDDE